MHADTLRPPDAQVGAHRLENVRLSPNQEQCITPLGEHTRRRFGNGRTGPHHQDLLHAPSITRRQKDDEQRGSMYWANSRQRGKPSRNNSGGILPSLAGYNRPPVSRTIASSSANRRSRLRPRLGKSRARVRPGRGNDSMPGDSSAPNAFNTARNAPWPLRALAFSRAAVPSRPALS